MQLGARIDYPPAAGATSTLKPPPALSWKDLTSCGGNIAATGRVFGITRPVIYDILAKEREGDLRDWPTLRYILPRNHHRLAPPSRARPRSLPRPSVD